MLGHLPKRLENAAFSILSQKLSYADYVERTYRDTLASVEATAKERGKQILCVLAASAQLGDGLIPAGVLQAYLEQ